LTDKPYQVGFGRPPQHSRFTPGKSGNPRGRPKGSRNAVSVLRDQLAQTIDVTVNGKMKRMTMLEGIVKAAAVKGLKGDPRPLIQALELLEKLEAGQLDEQEGPVTVTLVFEEEDIRRMEMAEREEAERLAAQREY